MRNDWIKSESAISKSKRSYAHFDARIDFSKCGEYISDPSNIEYHSFYPFIHFQMKFKKYNKENGKRDKKREIYYASHIDR